jgi:hypothetical protein
MNILDDLRRSNIDFAAKTTRTRATWRWPNVPGDPVPVSDRLAADGHERERVLLAQAMSTINATLGIELLRPASRLDLGRELILVHFGTAYVPKSADPARYRANVSNSADEDRAERIEPGTDGDFASTSIHMHLGNDRCGVDVDHIIHEFGHALGLAEHFSGFGDDDVISAHFWNVLATLYAHPTGTPETLVKPVKIR